MYSKHAAAIKASDAHHPQHPMETRASHRLLNQQGIPRPLGALGETLPGGAAATVGEPGSNIPINFHRRSLGETGMLAYTEHANNLNQRRYQYNFPHGQGYGVAQQPMKGGGECGGGSGGAGGATGMGRKWASLPKLHHRRDPLKEEVFGILGSKRGEFKRPQSDIVFHEALSRPNSPVRPASESNGQQMPNISPRHRMQEYKNFIEKTYRGHQSNILSLTEEEANAFYEDDFETEDSGVEPELKRIPETPVDGALNDLNQPNQNIEIVPFPALAELNTQPAVIHNLTQPKPQPRNTSKQVTENGIWTKKGKTRTVKVTVNNNTYSGIQVLPDYPLTSITPDQKKYHTDTHKNTASSPRKQRQYSKQVSESAHYPLAENHMPATKSASPDLDLDEVIVPGVEEEKVPSLRPKQQHQATTPSKPAAFVNDITLSRANVPNRNPQPTLNTKPLLQTSPPSKQANTSPPLQAKPEKQKVHNVVNIKMNLRDSTDELSDISVMGSKVTSKPVPPSKDTKPKKANPPPQPVPRKATPVHKQKPPPIRIPTASAKVPQATATKDYESNSSATDLETKSVSKDSDNKPAQSKTSKEEHESKQDLSEEDTLPELRGVLKAKGAKKGKKKSVQFGPKFVREVTKITYPWNEVASSDSDSSEGGSDDDDEEDNDDDDDDDDASDIEELVEEELQTMISMEKDKDTDQPQDRIHAKNEAVKANH